MATHDEEHERFRTLIATTLLAPHIGPLGEGTHLYGPAVTTAFRLADELIAIGHDERPA